MKQYRVLPEYPCHCMPSSIVEWGVMLIRLPIWGVWVQWLFKLRVALVQLVGEHLISVNQSLSKLGRYIPHRSAPSSLHSALLRLWIWHRVSPGNIRKTEMILLHIHVENGNSSTVHYPVFTSPHFQTLTSQIIICQTLKSNSTQDFLFSFY